MNKTEAVNSSKIKQLQISRRIANLSRQSVQFSRVNERQNHRLSQLRCRQPFLSNMVTSIVASKTQIHKKMQYNATKKSDDLQRPPHEYGGLD